MIGILGGIAFAFSTYNPIIIGVGHETKMLAIAFMPLLMAGMILTYEKNIGLVYLLPPWAPILRSQLTTRKSIIIFF